LYEAAHAGVEIKMIIRGIFCPVVINPKFKKPITAISIVDEYLEHARVVIFNNGGKPKVYISSADWMVRNLDHRVEAAVAVTDKKIIREITEIIQIQLHDNVKARRLDNKLLNNYVREDDEKRIRSQIETYQYLSDQLNEKIKSGNIPIPSPVIEKDIVHSFDEIDQ
jgi:polyphosphate kinase